MALLAAGFTVFFTAYLFGQHDAFHTNAEDMGIMTQALWNTTHGAPLHQTICNIISDTNCLGDVSRLAIHFEPIMFVIAFIYALAPSPKTLQLIQALVVAAGAFPVYWIAARRLRSVPVGVLFALLYLVYPALDSAVTSDFHAVTLAAPLLMFALYFLLTRNVWGFFVASGIAITTKEEVVLTVAMLGLYALVVQGRRRFAAVVLLMAAGYLVMELMVMHALSPVGHSPLASRYAAFGSSPFSIVIGVVTHPLLVVQRVPAGYRADRLSRDAGRAAGLRLRVQPGAGAAGRAGARPEYAQQRRGDVFRVRAVQRRDRADSDRGDHRRRREARRPS